MDAEALALEYLNGSITNTMRAIRAHEDPAMYVIDVVYHVHTHSGRSMRLIIDDFTNLLDRIH